MIRGLLAAVALGAASLACATGRLAPPPSLAPETQPAPLPSVTDAEVLERFAPVIFQEHEPRAPGWLDQPAQLDADDSGALADDAAWWDRALRPASRVPVYAQASSGADHTFLFYGLYYPVDWSGPADRPRFDHPGDLEGALLVVSRTSGRVEAAITQAHRVLYLWLSPQHPGPKAGTSGTLALTSDGRPLLFAETGGHGLYAFGSGSWRPKGGRRYARGPAAVPRERLLCLEPIPGACPGSMGVAMEIRPLAELTPFCSRVGGPFRDLKQAKPPWLWSDRYARDGGRHGAIVNHPGELYQALLRARRP